MRLLKDEEINKAVGKAVGCHYIKREVADADREIAKAQHQLDSKEFYKWLESHFAGNNIYDRDYLIPHEEIEALKQLVEELV